MLKRDVPEMIPQSDNFWKKIVTGEEEVDLKFLAAKILLSRLKLQTRLIPEPALVDKGAVEFRGLYTKRGYLPDAKLDIGRFFGKVKKNGW